MTLYALPLAAYLLALGAQAPEVRGVQVVQSSETGSVTAGIGKRTVELGVYGALLIAIQDYRSPIVALETPRKDVETLRDILTSQYGFPAKNVRMLLDSEATRSGILDALAAYRDGKMGRIDNLLIYYAGHGHLGRANDGFWIPSDAPSTDESALISADDVRRILSNVSGMHTLLIADSCFAGALTRKTVEADRYLSEVVGKRSYQVITSGGLEPVADKGRDGLSLFAYPLARYLRSQPRLYVTAGRLFTELAPQVSNASDSRQTPEYGRMRNSFDEQGEFVFVRTDGRASLFPAEEEVAPSPRPTSSAEQQEWERVLEEFLIPFQAILDHNYKVFQELTDDRELGHLEGHPLRMQGYFQNLPDSDTRKIDWKLRIERLLAENRKAVDLYERWRGKIIGADFRKACEDFVFHANKWADLWNAVMGGGELPAELSGDYTFRQHYAPGFPPTLPQTLAQEITEVRRRAGR